MEYGDSTSSSLRRNLRSADTKAGARRVSNRLLRPHIESVRGWLLLFWFVVQLPATAAGASPETTRSATAADASRVEVPQPSDKALQFYRSGNVLWLLRLGWRIAVPAAILFSGLSARIRDFSRRLWDNWLAVTVIYYVLFSLVWVAADLPLDFYVGYVRSHAYGLSVQSLARWVKVSATNTAISLGVGSLLIWIPFLLLRRCPQRWWIYTGLLALPVLLLMMLIEPIWIAPLYNDFGAMNDAELERRIVALADRAGIAGSRVFEVNKSVDTTAINAYVVGFMHSKRIVLWDTLIARLTPDELLVVMAHEMGHYVLNHVARGLALGWLLIVVTLFVLHRTAGAAVRRFQSRWGVSGVSDIASLPLLYVLISLFLLVVTPIELAVSRYAEHEADRFALELTRDNRAAATAFVKLQTDNLSIPRPGWLFKLWRSSHPSIGDRIDFCNDYRPWSANQPLRYEHLFAPQ